MAVWAKIEVWGKPYRVITHQKTETVWVAVGEYMGKSIEGKDRSEATAIKRWKEQAHSRGAKR
jgi:hypothetical protein